MKMMKKYRAFISFAVLLVSIKANAAITWANDVEIDEVSIRSIGFVLYPKNAPIQNCASFRFYENQGGQTLEGARAATAGALAAAAQGLTVDVKYDDVNTNCYSVDIKINY